MSKQKMQKMTAQELSKVLDDIISAANVIRRYSLMDSIGQMELTSYFSGGVADLPEVHLYMGARWAAELLGVPYTVINRNDKEYPYKGYFTYKEYQFFELLNDEKIKKEEELTGKEEA